MCGFFGISDRSLVKTDFQDINERGEVNFTFIENDVLIHQSVLSVTGHFPGPHVFDTGHFRFTFTGEIYNAPTKGYSNDTEWLAEKIAREDYNFDDVNGQYAISVYDKKKQTITLIRDPVGQVPLFYYNHNCLIYSNTIKSIATTIGAKLDKAFIKKWHQLRHYTLDNTHYKKIKLFPKGLIITYNMRGRALKSRVIRPKRISDGNVFNLLKNMQRAYSSHRVNCGIVSGGVDSSIISSLYRDSMECYITTINEDKCWASADIKKYGFSTSLIEVRNNEKEWCEAAIEYMHKSYMVPYTWSYVGYYIMGKEAAPAVKVMVTGEGADEIFGGYDVYNTNKLSKYSMRKDRDGLNHKYKQQVAKQVPKFNNVAQANKYLDQRSFLPCAAIGANLALGMSCIESRNPFLDHSIFYNDAFVRDIGKQRLIKIFKDVFNFDPPKKQGFSGYMNELYNYVNNTEITNDPKDISLWKNACNQIMKTI
jgi:asparagine synthase (glutamine-hydrolysing)